MIFHLAAIPSGGSETDFEAGYRANLDGTRNLLEAIRKTGDGYKPKVIYTSSIAVYGAPFPPSIPDDFVLTPLTSYGAHKVICETLLADYNRRGLPRRRRRAAVRHHGAAGQAEPGGVRFLFRHHPRAARGPRGHACRCRRM